MMCAKKTVRVTSQWFEYNRSHFETYLLEKGIPDRKDALHETDSDADESGLEIEREDLEETITHPFNPEQIKINTRTVLVEQLVSRIRHKEIDLAPDFQHHSNI